MVSADEIINSLIPIIVVDNNGVIISSNALFKSLTKKLKRSSHIFDIVDKDTINFPLEIGLHFAIFNNSVEQAKDIKIEVIQYNDEYNVVIFFLNNLSHHYITSEVFFYKFNSEIRTVLNEIITPLLLLGKTNLNPKQNKFYKMIKKSSFGLIELLDGILEYTNLLRNGQLSLTEISIEELLLECCKISLPNEIKTKIIINDDVDSNYIGDKQKLQFIILEIIKAILNGKHYDKEIITINVEKYKTEKDYDYIKFILHSNLGITLKQDIFDEKILIQENESLKIRPIVCKKFCNLMEGNIISDEKSITVGIKLKILSV